MNVDGAGFARKIGPPHVLEERVPSQHDAGVTGERRQEVELPCPKRKIASGDGRFTPAGIDPDAVGRALVAEPEVVQVHDLHVWTVTSGVIAMSGHLVVQNPGDNQRVLEAVQQRLGGMGIRHVTVQMERDPTCD